jgi:hypothetical protein
MLNTKDFKEEGKYTIKVLQDIDEFTKDAFVVRAGTLIDIIFLGFDQNNIIFVAENEIIAEVTENSVLLKDDTEKFTVGENIGVEIVICEYPKNLFQLVKLSKPFTLKPF